MVSQKMYGFYWATLYLCFQLAKNVQNMLYIIWQPGSFVMLALQTNKKIN